MSNAVREPDHEVSLDDEPYEFYILGVWEEDDGFYLSTDSGCSCPCPWENHTEESLTGPLTWDQVVEEARSLAETAYHRGYASEQVEEFINNKESK